YRCGVASICVTAAVLSSTVSRPRRTTIVAARERSRASTSVLHDGPSCVIACTVPSPVRSVTFAFSGARTPTRTRSSPRSPSSPDGTTLVRSTSSFPVSGSGGGSGRSRIWTVAVATSSPLVARSSYRGASSRGTGSHPRKAPFGRTGTSVLLIVSCAAPEPVDPNMKFESSVVSNWLGDGYTTCKFSGPSTAGIGGSATGVAPLATAGGFAVSRGAGGAGCGAGAATGGGAVRAGPGDGAGACAGFHRQADRSTRA